MMMIDEMEKKRMGEEKRGRHRKGENNTVSPLTSLTSPLDKGMSASSQLPMNTLQHNTIQYNIMQCNAVQCTAIQLTQYNTIQVHTVNTK